MNRKLLLTAVVLCCALCSFAQTDSCVAHLKDAGTLYDQGNYDEAIDLLESTIHDCDLNKTDRIGAYKLLILCYIPIDNLEGADAAAEKIMKLNPNYTPDKFRDNAGLIRLFQKYKPHPVFSVGINGGINMPFIGQGQQYSVVYPNGEAPESYGTNTGFQLGIQVERRIYKGLWGALGLNYRSSSYQHTLFDVDSATIHYSEKLSYFEFPLYLKYYFQAGHFRPYLEAGVYASFLSSALSTTTSDLSNQKDIINRMPLRNITHIGYMGAAGIGYAIKSFLVFADVRYVNFPGNVNKADARYADEVNLFKYYYIDNDFRLNNLQLGIGASFMLSYKNSRR